MSKARAKGEGQRVSFTRRAARRISRAVRAVEGGRRDAGATSVPYMADEDVVRRGTFTAPWNKGATATVTDAAISSVTYTAKNYFAAVSGTGTKACAIAWACGEWILIEVEKTSDSGSCRAPTVGGDVLTTLPGYSASKKQVLAHDQGCLKWIDIEECPTT